MDFWDVEGNDGGFLPGETAQEGVPYELFEHDRVLRNVVQLAEEGVLRDTISGLPLTELILNEDDEARYQAVHYGVNSIQINTSTQWLRLSPGAEQETAFTVFSMLASAYVHALSSQESNATTTKESSKKNGTKGVVTLPLSISSPLKRLAQEVRRLPIVDYAAIVLSNWKLVDKNSSVSLDNIRILRTFTGTSSEEWFYKIHIVIEAYGGQAMCAIFEAMNLAHLAQQKNMVEELVGLTEQLKDCLKRLAAALKMMVVTLSRMQEGCKEDQFYDIIRPWLGSWPKQGVVYPCSNTATQESATDDKDSKGIEASETTPKPLHLGGGSGAQSTLLPCIDAFLGIEYGVEDEHAKCIGMKKFVEQLAKYRLHMPLTHVQLLDRLENSPSVRTFISQCNRIVGHWNPLKMDKDIEDHPFDANSQDSSSKVNPQEEDDGRTTQHSALLHDPSQYNTIPLLMREQQRIQAAKLSEGLFEVRQIYNECLEGLLSFRRKHVGLASMYITRRAKVIANGVADEKTREELKKKATVGTGGSTFAKHLLNHVNDTRKALYPLRLPPSVVVDAEEELGIPNQSGLNGLLIRVGFVRDNNNSWYNYGIFEKLKDQVDKLSSFFVPRQQT